MKIGILPETKVGWWSVGLIVLWPLLSFLGAFLANSLYAGVEAGNGLIDDLRVRPLLAIVMLSGIASGVVSFGLSLNAIIEKKERSLIVFLAALVGLFLIFLLMGELFIEH